MEASVTRQPDPAPVGSEDRRLQASNQSAPCRSSGRSSKEVLPLDRNPHRRRGGWRLPTAPLVAALEAAGVIFIEENGEGPGVRLRKAVAQ
ncbi:transcriptional regulator [Methylobacterium pseudosasicola]|uniref:transcriptional regulator n=1 Tax=Methylobacterium pseudosasicola TaxID=582667 RepID=UPI003CC79FDA